MWVLVSDHSNYLRGPCLNDDRFSINFTALDYLFPPGTWLAHGSGTFLPHDFRFGQMACFDAGTISRSEH